MTERVRILTDEIRKLTIEERSQLLDALLSGVTDADSGVDEAWVDETEKRIDAYVGGKISSKDARDVLARHLKP